MKYRNCLLLLFGLPLVLFASVCPAAVFISEDGKWPADWPQELESLRKSARTMEVGTGIQQDIYEIPIPDRATFDKVWPAILKLRTPGSPLTLYRTGSQPPKDWGDLLSNKQPTIRIYGPSGGYLLTKAGRQVPTRGPWPKKLIGKRGELPEFVGFVTNKEGADDWLAADPTNDNDQKTYGFLHRARIDVELVVDGTVIDLNNLQLPEGVTVIDHRFDKGSRP